MRVPVFCRTSSGSLIFCAKVPKLHTKLRQANAVVLRLAYSNHYLVPSSVLRWPNVVQSLPAWSLWYEPGVTRS